jgi:arylsulfatase A-like enzyme
MMTGRWPHATGVLGLTHGPFRWALNDDEVHLAQFLAAAGYTTHLIGVQHVVPEARVARLGYHTREPGGKAPNVGKTVRARLEQQKDSGKPFFLSVGFVQPHRDFRMHDTEPDSSMGVYVPGYVPQQTEAQAAAARAEFAEIQGAIRDVDAGVDIILGAVDELGLRDNTVVVFTADHGIAMPRAKCSLYDPGIEVPLIMRAPMWGTQPGTRLEGLVSNVDYFPTFAEALELEPPPGRIQGLSFLAYLRGGKPHRSEIFAEKTYHTDYDPLRCVRTEKFKCIINFDLNEAYDSPTDIKKGAIYRTGIEHFCETRRMFELYDLTEDRWELNNVSGAEQYARVEEELRGRILAWMRETQDPLLRGPVGSRYYGDVMKELGVSMEARIP